jgi:hypothetical protein
MMITKNIGSIRLRIEICQNGTVRFAGTKEDRKRTKRMLRDKGCNTSAVSYV